MSFYLTLPSNSSMFAFPNNTQSNFTTILPKTLYLNNNYEVGLAEISYTNSFQINIGSITIIQDVLFNQFNEKYGTKKIDLFVDDCLSFEQFIILINNEITKNFKDYYIMFSKKNNIDDLENDRNIFMPRFKSFNNPDMYFTIDMPVNTSILFDGPIIEILKLNFNKLDSRAENGYKYFVQTLFDPILHLCDNLLVYTDIITDQLYGDIASKILRNVVPQGTHGEKVSITYDSIHYVDLKLTSIKTININIRDSQGELIHFNNKLGKVVIKLHFKLK